METYYCTIIIIVKKLHFKADKKMFAANLRYSGFVLNSNRRKHAAQVR